MKIPLILLCSCFFSFFLFPNEEACHAEILGTEMHPKSKSPSRLYKIVSIKHWLAIQNRKSVILPTLSDSSIHFLKEKQVEKSALQDWCEASEYAILTFETSKFKGELKDKSDGMCLHDGTVPFDSILECKIVYRHPKIPTNASLLDIIPVGDSVLRQRAKKLSLEEILSPEIQSLIKEMKATMRGAPGVGLAAPQIGRSIQLAVIEDMDHSHLSAEQVSARECYPVPFHVIINPTLYIEECTDTVDFFEGCLSIPHFIGIVPRAKAVRVECLNEKGEAVVIRANGWYSRILQHEIDHLNGVLYLDRAYLPTLITEESYMKFWRGKSIQDIRQALSHSCKNHT